MILEFYFYTRSFCIIPNASVVSTFYTHIKCIEETTCSRYIYKQYKSFAYDKVAILLSYLNWFEESFFFYTSMCWIYVIVHIRVACKAYVRHILLKFHSVFRRHFCTVAVYSEQRCQLIKLLYSFRWLEMGQFIRLLLSILRLSIQASLGREERNNRQTRYAVAHFTFLAVINDNTPTPTESDQALTQ